MSLWDKIQFGVDPIKPLTLDDIQTFMTYHQPYENDRQLVVMTGSAGMDRFHSAIKEEVLRMEMENNRDHTVFLFEKNIITERQKDVILQMINSPDRENYTVAKSLLEHFTKLLPVPNLIATQNVSNISIRKSPVHEYRSE